MSRYTHDGSCTIISQYIIRKPDRYLCSVQRVDRVSSCKYTCFFFVLQTVYIRLHGCIVDILFHSFSCFIGSQFFCHGMLRSQYHEGCTVKGIRAGGVYSDLLVFSFNREFNFCTIGFTDPVTLHLFNFFRPVQFVQVIQQTVCIFCDTKHPLF